VVLLQGRRQHRELADALDDLFGRQAQRLQEDGDRLLALAVDPDPELALLVDLELQPGTPARDDLAGVDVGVGGLVGRLLEVDARRPDQLAHDDAVGAVDDERALVGHQREIAHEDRLRLDLAGLVVHELRGDEERRGVGEVLLLALVHRVLRLVELRSRETQGHRPLEVLDRTDLLEDLREAGLVGDRAALGPGLLDTRLPGRVAHQPVEGVDLEGEQIRGFQRFTDLRERDPGRSGGAGLLRRGARGQEASFRGCRTHLLRSLRAHACRPRSNRGDGRGRRKLQR
jgi:hypothetical protein